MELAELKNSKKNGKKLENTAKTSSEPSTPSYSYDKLNEYTDTSRKKTFSDTF